MERLQKYIARCGICSRRAAEKHISDGNVLVNDAVAVPGMKIDPLVDTIIVSGERVLPHTDAPVYIALNKPQKVLSTRKDDRGRLTVIHFVEVADTYVYPVGRLDYDSSGLILLTNDGALSQRLLHPSHKVSKTYRVLVSRALSHEEMELFQKGITVDGRKTAPTARIRHSTPWIDCSSPENPSLSRQTGAVPAQRVIDTCADVFWYEIVLKEGRKRQIRRMIDALGAKVVELIRVKFGPVSLMGLPRGWHRRLTCEEVDKLKGPEVHFRSMNTSKTGRDANEKGKQKAPPQGAEKRFHKRKRRSENSRYT